MIHKYELEIDWLGNLGKGTLNYQSYSRDYLVKKEGKIDISCSSDVSFRGDKTKWNPEELFVSSISACHKLWYLHLCAINKVIVISYIDFVCGIMRDEKENNIGFESITLNPQIIITKSSSKEIAINLHKKAHKYCFLANSVNFDILCNPIITFDNN